MKVKLLSRVWLLATPWTAAYQAPPSVGFSRPRVLEWGAIVFSLYQYGLVHIYFILRVIIPYYVTLLFGWFQLWQMEALSGWLLSPHPFGFFENFFTFWHCRMLWAHLSTFLTLRTQFLQTSLCVFAKWFQSYLNICNPMDYSPPGSSVHEILQARILEWVVMPYSSGSSWLRGGTHISLCFLHRQASSVLLAPPGKPPNQPISNLFGFHTNGNLCISHQLGSPFGSQI